MFYALFISLNLLWFGFGLKNDEGWNFINLHCRDNQNAPVDWWYLYKPAGEAAPYDDSGRNFSFIVSDLVSRWIKPDKHITTNNMLYHTMAPMYRGTYVNHIAFMVFDDAEPGASMPGAKARGILMADEIGGLFITHSVPRLVKVDNRDRPKFPDSELINGHLLMCVSVDLDTLNQIAMLVKHIGANLAPVQVPEHMEVIFPSWIDQKEPGMQPERPSWLNQPNGPLEFTSRQSKLNAMVLFRRPDTDTCLYRTFAQKQGVVLDVYSPYGQSQTNSCDNSYGVRSIGSISLKIVDEKVHYLNNKTDKTRFAVSTAASWQRRGRRNPQYWTCTSGLDKDDSSSKGGMLICVDNYEVWSAFDNFKVKEPEC